MAALKVYEQKKGRFSKIIVLASENVIQSTKLGNWWFGLTKNYLYKIIHSVVDKIHIFEKF